MLTEAQVLEIERHCKEQGVPYKQRLEELNINPNQFYRTKRKLLFRLDSSSNGQFLQIGTDNSFMEAASQLKHKRKKGTPGTVSQSLLCIELRNDRGTAMRIQGEMQAEHLRAILSIMESHV